MLLPYTRNKNKTLLLASLAIASFGLSGYAQTVLIDQTTQNGGFEAPALATGGKVADGFDDATNDVPFWANTGTTAAGAVGGTNDIGFENDGVGTGASGSNQYAYWHGGQTGAFNLTTTTIHTGDQFSLSWFGSQDTLRVQIIASTDGTYANSTVLATIDQAQPTFGHAFVQYFLPTYTAAAADAGKFVGIAVFDPLGANSYANGDSFTLTVVPEPSAYALMFAGLGALFLLFRVRRAVV